MKRRAPASLAARLVAGLMAAALAIPPAAAADGGPSSQGASASELGMLADPADRARYRAIAEELRCLVCQNQSLVDSPAGLAGDLRHELERMILEQRSDDEIKRFMVDRYGDFVLFRPPMQGSTWALWIAPFALLLGGMVFWTRLRQRSDDEVEVDLEQARRRLEASD